MDSSSCLLKLCIVFFMVLGCNISRGDENLLLNESFETAGAVNIALNWDVYKCGYTRSDDVSNSGSWSCKITGNGGENEIGLGGTFFNINSGFPASGTFNVSSNIYMASYTQGRIYGTYVSVKYADSSQEIFNSILSVAEITENMHKWKKYNLSFTTNASKTISSISCWCLVWAVNGKKFIGTVYFDDVNITILKPVL